MASKFNDDELMSSIVEDSSVDKNIKILHFTGNYDPDILKQQHKDLVSSSVADKLIPDHNKIIFVSKLFSICIYISLLVKNLSFKKDFIAHFLDIIK